jgi:pimeloyl-ACP methyl ester carboxylesterase
LVAATSTGVLMRLATRWRVVCPDLPGQPGLSAASRPVDEVAGYEEWLTEVLDHLRRRRRHLPLVLAGHSRGAAAALLANPANADGLVLVSPAGLAKVRLSPTILWRSIAWLQRPTPARSRRLIEMMLGGSGSGGDSHTDWLTLVAKSTRTTGAPDPLPIDVLDRWHGENLGVLVGERDVFFTPAALSEPVRRLGATLDVVPEAGHLLTDQRPDLVVAACSQVLR